MFKFLKNKIGNWAKKVSEETEIVETIEEKPKKEREIKIPLKFNVGAKKYEPNLEKLKETADEIKEEIHLEPSLDKQLRGKTVGKDLKDLEEAKPGTKSFFKKITSKIGKVKISEKEFEVYSEELEMLLLENNVALEVAEKMIQKLKERIVGKELLKKEIETEIKDVFKEIIEEILIEPFDLVEKIKEKISDQSKEPYVILFCGINGSGKTTTIAKIADFLKHKEISCVLAASDTFRAASIEQIKEHGEKIRIKVISHDYGSDPAAVGFDAIKYAKKNFIDCVLIDTAGRMHTAKNLLKEIEKISRVCKPDLKLFVGESITGNDVIEQARTFDWAIGIDGIILTKADIDEKGGTALSVGYIIKKPILYLGTGQSYDKIVVFDKKKFIEKLGL
jgi:fused signal recognition particle receptor